MSKLYTERLVNASHAPGGDITCQCPACALLGEDETNRNHLRIYKKKAFSCIKYQGDREHNKIIYSLLFDSAENSYDIEEVAVQRPSYLKFYPEDSLLKLVKDHGYWVNRKISPDVMSLLEGGIAPVDERNKLSGRYCFPIRDMNKKIVGFSGRLIANNEFIVKWKHLFKVRDVAYPFHIAHKHIKESGSVVLVESIGDMLALMNHGIYNVLVIFGLNIQSKVISALISTNPSKIIISTNNDSDKTAAGNKAANKIYSKLRNFFDEPVVEIHIPKSKDWGEANEKDGGIFEIEELKLKINAKRN